MGNEDGEGGAMLKAGLAALGWAGLGWAGQSMKGVGRD